MARQHRARMLSAGWAARSAARRRPARPLTIDKSDYDAFEQLLGDVQAAYSAEDLAALRAKVTPEMLSYFSEQLARECEPRPDQSRHRREAAARRPGGSLARRRRRLCHRRHALRAHRQHGGARQRPHRRGRQRRARSPNYGPSGAPAAAAGCSRRSSRRKDENRERAFERAARSIGLGRFGFGRRASARRPVPARPKRRREASARSAGIGQRLGEFHADLASACATSRGSSGARRRCWSASARNGRAGSCCPARRCARRYRKRRTPRNRAAGSAVSATQAV